MTTVKQLIEKLKEYPVDTVVSVLERDTQDIADDFGVGLVKVNLSRSVLGHREIKGKHDAELDCLKGERLLISEDAGMCNFKLGWAGRCKESGDPFCDKHRKERCRTCGSQATRHCSYSVSLVCGAPVCNNCEWCPTHGGKNPVATLNKKS